MSPVTIDALNERMAELVAGRIPFARATVVRARRPTSASPGDTALILQDGQIEGFVGGSCAEATVRRFCLEALQSGEPLLLRISPDQMGDGDLVDGAISVGNPCLSGGELEIFIEPRRPAPRVVVLGGTPIGRNLVVLGQDLGYDIQPVEDGFDAQEAMDGAAAVIVASHGQDEEPVLTEALRREIPYVALVASRKRAAAVLVSLEVTPEQRASVRSPAGLDIGARSASEVALSILAEVVASIRSQPVDGVVEAPVSGVTPDGLAAPGQAGDATDTIGEDGIEGGVVDGVSPTKKVDRFQVAFAIDPICGMTVPAIESSVHSDVGGPRQWFCCVGCKRAFEVEQASVSAG